MAVTKCYTIRGNRFNEYTNEVERFETSFRGFHNIDIWASDYCAYISINTETSKFVFGWHTNSPWDQKFSTLKTLKSRLLDHNTGEFDVCKMMNENNFLLCYETLRMVIGEEHILDILKNDKLRIQYIPPHIKAKMEKSTIIHLSRAGLNNNESLFLQITDPSKASTKQLEDCIRNFYYKRNPIMLELPNATMQVINENETLLEKLV